MTTEHTGTVATTVPERSVTPGPAWVHRVMLAAGIWSLLYGVLGVYWALGGSGFPFGAASDPGASVSMLEQVEAASTAPVIAVGGLLGSAAALSMALVRSPAPIFRWILLAAGGVFTVTLVLVVPDYRLLVTVAYLPILVVGAPFAWPQDASLADAVPWPVANQMICAVGGLLWFAATLGYLRLSRRACVRCGRSPTVAPWTSPAAAARWGRWAVAIAVVIPVVYAVTRLAWLVGIPLGISESFLRELQSSGAVVVGGILGLMGVGGALLTLGLVQRWGEVFPRWIPWLAGRRVPISLAVIPALLVAVLVTSAGLTYIRLTVTDRVGDLFGVSATDWAAAGPELLWPLWGIGLAAAALAYYYRRRGRCPSCGRS